MLTTAPAMSGYDAVAALRAGRAAQGQSASSVRQILSKLTDIFGGSKAA